jgi:diphthamide synthase (EF-2-diphthine--ammonia ligase)
LLNRSTRNVPKGALKSLRQKFEIDACGENGEYDTMVLDGPTFKQFIQMHEFSKGKENSMLFLKVNRCSLQPKIPRSSQTNEVKNGRRCEDTERIG